ncbi:MAG: hypothetical protein R3B91_01695 [Planctomycetaceae bacterium]
MTTAGIREFWRVFPDMTITDAEHFAAGDPEEAALLLRETAGRGFCDDENSQHVAARRETEGLPIYEAFKRREEQVRSFRFEWKQTIVIDHDADSTEDDITCPQESSLSVDGERAAYVFRLTLTDRRRPEVRGSMPKWQLTNMSCQERFDGLTGSRSLYEYPDFDREPIVTSRPACMCSSINTHYNMPLVYSYRLMKPPMGDLNWTEIEVLDPVEIDGHRRLAFRNARKENTVYPVRVNQWFCRSGPRLRTVRYTSGSERIATSIIPLIQARLGALRVENPQGSKRPV